MRAKLQGFLSNKTDKLIEQMDMHLLN